MSVTDLEDYVWSDLSPIKWVAGRRLVARLTRRCAKRVPCGFLAEANADGQRQAITDICRDVERIERQNYQMGVFLTLILSALLTEIVKAIFQWWSRSASNRTLLVGWQQENVL